MHPHKIDFIATSFFCDKINIFWARGCGRFKSFPFSKACCFYGFDRKINRILRVLRIYP